MRAHLHLSDPALRDKIVAIGAEPDPVVIEVEGAGPAPEQALSDLYSVLLQGAGPRTQACVCLRSDAADDKVQRVVLGGTFDHLHLGHKLLLACALYYVHGQTPARIVVGLTSDLYLAANRKPWSTYVQSYQERRQRLLSFIRSIDDRVEVQIEPLNDVYGPALNADLDAIVVSGETASGAKDVNRKRHELGTWSDGRIPNATSIRERAGLPPLRVIVAKAIGAAGSSKLSSTWIREQLHGQHDGP